VKFVMIYGSQKCPVTGSLAFSCLSSMIAHFLARRQQAFGTGCAGMTMQS